ncbi:flippase [Paraburkholderia sartisoli]|uniref:Membrane protein involved in the export of O-antigen and teichoic acid n=1 Tax=Paraburkholderia sartisoli TaxID=83784 RepID=A0A1H4EC69_9BURK|nr:flippase [Paraburkholderia sartisoli]SEA82641.1 Membrane protein involved in the export of O-antigen and teichoic acid [Paraburkholderia sartisoli]
MDSRILRNVGLNLLGTAVPIAISFVTVPGYLLTLGAERYGVMNLVWTLIGYFGVLDMGISLATENRISIARAAKDQSHERVEQVFFSALFVNFMTGTAGALLLWGISFTWLKMFGHLSPAFSQEVYASLPWLAVAIPLANLTWVMAGSLTGAERFAVFNLNQVFGMATFQCLPLVAAHWISPTLPVVIATAVATRFLGAIIFGVSTWRVLGLTGWRRPRWPIIKELFQYGSWIVIGGSAEMFAASIDRVIIGTMLGARAVAYYSTPQNLVGRLSVLPTAVMRTLFPRLSASSHVDAHELARQGIALVVGILTPCTIVVICALHPFLLWWVGSEIASAGTTAGHLVALSVWVGSSASVVRVLLQARADPGRAARISLVQLPVLAVLLWVGISMFGLVGAALAVLLKTLIDGALLIILSRLGGRALLGVLVPHALCLCMAIAIASVVDSRLMLAGAALVLVAVNLALSLALSAELRDFVHKFLERAGLGRRITPRTEPLDAET